MTAEDGLLAELRALRDRVIGVTDTALASRDGLIICADTADLDPESMAALGAASLGLARRRGVPMRAGWCNGQPAFATYQPGEQGRLTASGLQVLELADRDGRPRITAIVSFRSPALAARCGLPARLG